MASCTLIVFFQYEQVLKPIIDFPCLLKCSNSRKFPWILRNSRGNGRYGNENANERPVLVERIVNVIVPEISRLIDVSHISHFVTVLWAACYWASLVLCTHEDAVGVTIC